MGYDICRFKSKDIDREFICGICQDVLKNPVVINPCEHIYCSDCITKWIEEQGLKICSYMFIQGWARSAQIWWYRGRVVKLLILLNLQILEGVS